MKHAGITVGVVAILYCWPIPASASRGRCPVDLAPLANVAFNVALINDATTDRTGSSGTLLLSVGGAVTLMRTDLLPNGTQQRTFVSGQLNQFDLKSLQQLVMDVVPIAGSDPCLIYSEAEPGDGRHSLLGGSEITLFQPQRTARFLVNHNSASSGPTPLCAAEIEALDNLLRRIEDDLKSGVHPLQCRP